MVILLIQVFGFCERNIRIAKELGCVKKVKLNSILIILIESEENFSCLSENLLISAF